MKGAIRKYRNPCFANNRYRIYFWKKIWEFTSLDFNKRCLWSSIGLSGERVIQRLSRIVFFCLSKRRAAKFSFIFENRTKNTAMAEVLWTGQGAPGVVGREYGIRRLNRPPGVPRHHCILCVDSYDDVTAHFKSSDHIRKYLVSTPSILIPWSVTPNIKTSFCGGICKQVAQKWVAFLIKVISR